MVNLLLNKNKKQYVMTKNVEIVEIFHENWKEIVEILGDGYNRN